MVSICADGARVACANIANQRTEEAVSHANQSLALHPPSTYRDLPLLEIDWPHKIPEKEVAVYIEELQQPVDPALTGTVLDLLF